MKSVADTLSSGFNQISSQMLINVSPEEELNVLLRMHSQGNLSSQDVGMLRRSIIENHGINLDEETMQTLWRHYLVERIEGKKDFA